MWVKTYMYKAKCIMLSGNGKFPVCFHLNKVQNQQNYTMYFLIIQTWLSINKNKAKIKRKFRILIPLRGDERGQRRPKYSCS